MSSLDAREYCGRDGPGCRPSREALLPGPDEWHLSGGGMWE